MPSSSHQTAAADNRSNDETIVDDDRSSCTQEEKVHGDIESVSFNPIVKTYHFDPDAVDFEPIIKTYSGAAVSYHTHEHADELRSIASVATSTRSVCSPKSRKREQRSDTSITPLINNRKHKDPTASSSPNSNGYLDNYHYIVVSMGMFIMMVLVNNVLSQPNYFHSRMATILPKEMQDYIKKVYPPPVNTMIPPEIRASFKDVDDFPLAIMDTPLLWKIPRSGTTTLQLCLSMCMGRVVASEQGAEHRLDDVSDTCVVLCCAMFSSFLSSCSVTFDN